MHIDIVSDVICPWCFIGKRRLERALAERPGLNSDITWRPFQLNPEMPAQGMARADYLAAKFGSKAHATRVYDSIRAAGETVGIPFAFERIQRTPNTIDAHRLIRFADRAGHADALVDRLFDGYFLAGKDIGDRDTLATLAGEAGLDASEAAKFLGSSRDRAEIQADDAGARRLGINAVPCFIFAGQYAISGAQEPQFFFPVFDLVENGGGAGAKAAG
jgi:predicted DsbA family dithiol-disulfide isomerase